MGKVKVRKRRLRRLSLKWSFFLYAAVAVLAALAAIMLLTAICSELQSDLYHRWEERYGEQYRIPAQLVVDGEVVGEQMAYSTSLFELVPEEESARYDPLRPDHAAFLPGRLRPLYPHRRGAVLPPQVEAAPAPDRGSRRPHRPKRPRFHHPRAGKGQRDGQGACRHGEDALCAFRFQPRPLAHARTAPADAGRLFPRPAHAADRPARVQRLFEEVRRRQPDAGKGAGYARGDGRPHFPPRALRRHHGRGGAAGRSLRRSRGGGRRRPARADGGGGQGSSAAA